VIAVTPAVEHGVFTGEIETPIPYDRGKVDMIDKKIRRRPCLAAGKSSSDVPMLQLAENSVLVINPSPELEAIAQRRSWSIQRFEEQTAEHVDGGS